jgi:glycosyltransferase involved in cell wall biosynthesis
VKKVVIVQRFLPHYRSAFLQELSQRAQNEGFEVQLLYGRHLGKQIAFPFTKRLPAVSFPVPLGEIRETFVWMPGLVRQLNAEQPSLLLLEDVSGLPNSLAAAGYAKKNDVPYAVWGLGRIPNKRTSPLRFLLSAPIHRLYTGAKAFISYSRHGADVYRTISDNVFVAPNACLPAPSNEQQQEVRSAIDRRPSGASPRAVTMGTLIPQKRTEVLLEALTHSGGQGWTLDIVGDGSERPRLERLAQTLGIASRVRFHGAIYDGAAKRRVLLESDLGVLGGRGGLVIQEMMAHGLPVVSGPADGTERDLIQTGENGFLINGTVQPADVSNILQRFASLSLEHQRALASAALNSVVKVSNVESMAAGCMEAIRYLDKHR